MKKTLAFSLLFFAFVMPVLAQRVNVDSVVKVVTARNPRKANNFITNNDSLYKRLPFTKQGAQRVKLINDLFNYGIYPELKQNIDMGYKIRAWAKAHHDLIAEAVISAGLSTLFSQNGDKVTASQLQTEAFAVAKQANDNQALGIVYQAAFSNADIKDHQLGNYGLRGLKYSHAASDTLTIGWGYGNLAIYYGSVKKADSSIFYAVKSLDWAVKANRIYDICNVLDMIGYVSDYAHMDLKYLKAAYAISVLTNDVPSIPNTAGSISDYYFRVAPNMDSALVYAYEAYNAGKHLTVDRQVYNVKIIGEVYEKKRNIDSAVKYIRLYYTLNKQLNNNESMVRAQAITFSQKQKQQQAEADKAELRNTQQRWVLAIVIVFLLLIAFIFWRNNRLSHKANALLAAQKLQTELTLVELKSAQQQLIQSEKMASLGELTAGIAHEIQNPLNFVNNFSEVSAELIAEMNLELNRGDIAEAKAIADDVKQNLEKIRHHGKRAESIVKGMLEHSRSSTGIKEPTNLNSLADEYLRLAYHGLRAKNKSFNADLITNFDKNLPKVNLVQQDMGRVLLNLFNNAFYAILEKEKNEVGGYKPAVTVTTETKNNLILVSVRDNGTGMPDAIKDKIMQPFFTTKPAGQGTGLGLSLSYDIVVKGHGGQLTVTSVEKQFTQMEISIPI